MATDPDRSDEGAWTELEQDFFAAAPPDVPVPPPEPMRFDDLDPVPTALPRPAWRAGVSRAWAATAAAGIGLRSVTRAALRRSVPALARACQRSVGWARQGSAMLLTLLRGGTRDRRLLAAAAAMLILLTGASAVVVASRSGGAQTISADVRSAVRGGGTEICESAPAAPPAPAATSSKAEAAPPSAAPIAPEPAPPPAPKHKHLRRPANHAAQAKPANSYPSSPAVRPLFWR